MPSSVLRPYNDASDGVYVPVLLKSKYTSWIPASNQLFLLHPVVLSILVASASAAAYYVNNLFQTVLLVPGEALSYDEEATWKDSAANIIYAVPPIAGVVGLLFALGNWYHSRLWKRCSERDARTADVVDIPTYYNHPTSKFWCLEYESEIVAAWGVDGRNPARPLQIIDESRIPKRETEEVAPLNEPANEEAAKAVPKPTTDADDDDEYDLALFRHSTTSGPPPAPAGDATTTLTALASLESAKSAEPILQEADLAPAGPSYLPASATSNIKDAAFSLVEIRHLTLSETYKPTKGVEGQILAIAVQSAFQTSANIKYVLIRLDPKLDKTFRMHALKGGFQIMRNDIPLESGLDTTSFKDAVEALARKVWPLSFESEFLMLDKEKWQMPSN